MNRALKAPARALPELVGQILGRRYRVLRAIGRGGVATVYEATDLVTGEEVAIKAVHRRGAGTSSLERLRREARLSRSIDSAHICRVHHLGVEQGVPFIVMERLEGETLRERLRRSGPLPAADAIAITLQILDALEACHAAGFIHRDVKPSNVFVTTRPGELRAKLIDLGLARPIAKRRSRLREKTITTIDTVPGTPSYLTPEQICGNTDLDERVDVWGAGATLFEMLAGERLYRQSAVYALLVQQILFEPVPSVYAMRGDVPDEIDLVLQKALAKDREERFPTASALRQALIEIWARHRVRAIERGALLAKAPDLVPREEVKPKRSPRHPPEPPEVEIILESSSSC